MVFSAMAFQDQCGRTRPNPILPAGTGISLSAALHNVTGHQLKDQFSCGNDYSPKARKPYTITKQRERWTEEEHKKFLEALKLYGRAWRRIEEHVGTKTAVQIRSHAQKFFSKVVRESSGSNTGSMEPIEIPPPRPKRKPMHPYPRKSAHPLNKELLIPEKSLRSSSPNFSEQENHSPTSVLSAVASEGLGSTDSDSTTHSLSPVSSAGGVHPIDFAHSERNPSPEDDRSPSPVPAVTASSPPDVEFPKVQTINLCPNEVVLSEASVAEETSTRSLKLFGRTVLVTEWHRPSSTNIETSKLLPSDTSEEKPVQPLTLNFMAVETQSRNGEPAWGHLSHGPHGSRYCMQTQKENSSPAENDSATQMPWWTLYGGLPFPFIPFHKPEPVKESSDSSGEVVQDKETHKEGSWTGSNCGSVNEGENTDRNMDAETESSQVFWKEKDLPTLFELKLTKKSALSESKVSDEKCMIGFVPYKKRVAERDSQSSTITGEEREEQRIRLSL